MVTTTIPGAPSFAKTSWRALGTYVQLGVADADRLAPARARAEQLLAAVDLACSRFRRDSDLTRANLGAGSWVRVDPLLVAAVRAALDAAQETDGIVDPTLGRSLVALGYDADIDAVRARPDDPAAIPLPAVPDAWRAVGLREDAVLVPFGTALDLGATGKAFASDLLAQDLADGGLACIVSLGGDISIGVPTDETDETDQADETDETDEADRPGPVDWPVTIAELPDDPPVQTVLLDRGGLATSSVLGRSWTSGGRRVHHLIDPRTGGPAGTVWRTVTVAAGCAVAANTATTASIVLGEDAPAWLEARDLAARLISVDGRVTRVAEWPADDDLAAGGLP